MRVIALSRSLGTNQKLFDASAARVGCPSLAGAAIAGSSILAGAGVRRFI
jgi:hypothetical protein